MRKAIIIAAFAVTVCLLGGCDFFRVLAGRPTSREIEAKRALILSRDALAQQPAADTVRPVSELPETGEMKSEPQTEIQTEPATEKQTEQTHPAGTSPKAPLSLPEKVGDTKIFTRKAATFSQPRPEYRFYVMIGTFSMREFAVKQASKAEAAGFTTALLPFRSGLTAVGVCPTDDFDAVRDALEKVRSQSFFPRDAWILNVE
jgi:hypothetical protein